MQEGSLFESLTPSPGTVPGRSMVSDSFLMGSGSLASLLAGDLVLPFVPRRREASLMSPMQCPPASTVPAAAHESGHRAGSEGSPDSSCFGARPAASSASQSPSSCTAACVVSSSAACNEVLAEGNYENRGCSTSGGIPGSVTRRPWRLSDFELGQLLGSGSYGHIQLARECGSKAVVALKVLKKRRVERLRAQRHVRRELAIQAHLRHPYILRLHGFFWDKCCIYMILEYMSGGDLRRLLNEAPERRLQDTRAGCLGGQLARGLAYCHMLHVMHRDVKPENVLLSRHAGRVKLGDFGWAVHHGGADSRRWTLCGTLDYLAPEMVRGQCGHSFGIDDWALGVVFF